MKSIAILAGSILLLASCSIAGESAASPQDTPDEARPNQKMLMKLGEQGVDFYARGNEPSWVLDIDFDSTMKLATLDGLVLEIPSVEGVKAQDGDVTRYAAKSDSGSLIVTLIAGECTDSMSGEMFSHRVRVEVRVKPDEESQTFEGCGRYVPDFRLNDLWVLTQMHGEAIDAATLPKGLPTLELHIVDSRVVGHGGCNNIMGSFSIEWRTIQFGQIAGTMMACPDMTVETEFLKAISGKRLSYSLEETVLVLSDKAGTELKFKKVD
jgi:heat shock protein HslJ/uncharacterized membrane protein